MSTTFSLFTDVKNCCETQDWEKVIALCQQLEAEDRLTTEDLQYTQEYIKLYAKFAKNGFEYSNDLHYADKLTTSAHISCTFPHLRFLCGYIMLCGVRAKAPKIYLNENDYTRNMEEASYGMRINFQAIRKDKTQLIAALYPNFAFLDKLARMNIQNAVPVNVEGFRVESGVLVQYTGTDSIVNVPAGVVVIGEGAFSKATQPIVEVTLPEGVISIGAAAFFDADTSHFCSRHLKKVNTPSTLKHIGQKAFQQCAYMEEIDISTVEEIEDDAFKWCSSILKLDLKSLRKIGENVFWTCRSVEEIKNYKIGNYIPRQTFRDCGKLREFKIPESVTEVSGMAFSGCGSLEELDISHVEKFGWYAFSHCEKLKKIEFSPKVTSIAGYAFSGNTSLEEINLPPALEEIGGEAFKNCRAVKTLHIPDSVTKLGGTCFAVCTSLEDISISDNVEVIPESAFCSCTSLKKLKLPAKLTKIENSAFEGCELLEDFVMPASVKIIEKNAFKNCKNLTTLDLTNVEEIGAASFGGTKTLAHVKVRGSAKIHAKAFSGNRKLQIEFVD